MTDQSKTDEELFRELLEEAWDELAKPDVPRTAKRTELSGKIHRAFFGYS